MPVLPNPKHEIVAQYVATGKSWEEAMTIAGYTPSTARTGQGRMSANASVRARVDELLQAQANAKLVTSQKLHERWSEMFEADIADIVTEAGAFKPISEWPKVWRQMLSGVDVKELFERSKDGGEASWDKIGEVVKLKFVSVKELGELLGKHKAVDAFVQQKQPVNELHVHLHAEVESRLSRARELAANVSNPDIIEVRAN